jgi:lysophospholipase L1-like esterase
MIYIIPMGGCHIFSYKVECGFLDILKQDSHVQVLRRVSCRLSDSYTESLNYLAEVDKSSNDKPITVIYQVGNDVCSNSLGNLIGFDKASKLKAITNDISFTELKYTGTESQTPVQVSRLKQLYQSTISKVPFKFQKKKILTAFVQACIFPINLVYVPFVIYPKLKQFKKKVATLPNVNRVIVLTPFCAHLNGHWLFRKLGAVLYKNVFKNNVQYTIIDCYNLTNDVTLFLPDRFHLNEKGHKALAEAISKNLI